MPDDAPEPRADTKAVSDASLKKYLASFERLVACVEARCHLTGEDLSVGLLPSTLAIRSVLMSRSTMRFEVSGARFIVNQALDTGLWPGAVGASDWILEAPRAEIAAIVPKLWATPSQIAATGGDLVDELVAQCRAGGLEIDAEEFVRRVSRVETGRMTRVDNRGEVALTWRDWLAIEMALDDQDPETTVVNLIRLGSVRPKGLLRLFSATMFFTGMRPVEVHNFSFNVPNPAHAFTEAEKRLVRANPKEAIDRKLLVPVEETLKQLQMPEVHRAALACRQRSGGLPFVLEINAAKTTNQSAELKARMRHQILDIDSSRDVGLLAYASLCRLAKKLTRAQWDSARAGMLKVLTEIVDKEPSIERKEVNLYSFRHSFADRARQALKGEEVAALTGHTSRTTLAGYGKRGRKGRGSGDGWLPVPDPVRVEEIRLVWSGKDAQRLQKAPDGPTKG